MQVWDACFHIYQHRVDKSMNEHLSLERECVHSPIIFSPRVSKGLGSPSLGTPIVLYRLLLGFKMSKHKHPHGGGGMWVLKKIVQLLVNTYFYVKTKMHSIVRPAKLHMQKISLLLPNDMDFVSKNSIYNKNTLCMLCCENI